MMSLWKLIRAKRLERLTTPQPVVSIQPELKRRSLPRAELARGAAQRDLDKRLHGAAACGKDDEIKRLLVRGANPDATLGMENDSALTVACRHGHVSTVQLLLQEGATIRINEVYAGAFAKKVSLLRTLVEHSRKNGDDYRRDALVYASMANHLRGVRYLLKLGTPPSGEALARSCLAENYALARYLIGRGADLELELWDGKTVAQYLSEQGRSAFVELFTQTETIISEPHGDSFAETG